MNSKLVKIAASTAAIILLSACGSSSDDNKSQDASISISGNVIDPAVKGAKVKLVCGSNQYSAKSKSDESGSFLISNISSTQDLSNCIIQAEGGVDGPDDLTGLTLEAPYKLFTKGQGIYVTPLTTAISKHDALDSNITLAKDEVARFYGLFATDLLKDPTSKPALFKVSKKITKIALKRDNSGNLLGYLDIDTDTGESNLNDYISNDIPSKVSAKSLEQLTKEVASINEATDVNELIKNTISDDVYFNILTAYRLDEPTTQVKENINSLSKKLVEANKVESKYLALSINQIRKAFIDTDLYPSFKVDTENELKDELRDKLNLDTAAFETYINDANISISNITGLTLINSSEYEQILGDDNTKRINYYVYSEKSPISKSVKLLSTVYDDSVLNPASVKIATGLAKSGLYDEAIKVVSENIYSKYDKLDGINSIASIMISHNQNIKAKELVDKNVKNYKDYITSKGASNLEMLDTDIFIDIYYMYYRLGETSSAESFITYFQDNVSPSLTSSTAYGSLTYRYRDIIFDLIDDNKPEDAKFMFNAVYTHALNSPSSDASSAKFAISYMLEISLLGTAMKETDKVNVLLQKAKELDTQYGTGYAALTAAGYTGSLSKYASHAAVVAAITALNGDVDTVLNLINGDGILKQFFPTYKQNQNDSALEYGVIAAMFMQNRDDEAIELLYNFRPFKDYEVKDDGSPWLGNQIYRKYMPRDITYSLDNARILKAYDKNVMVRYLDKLVSDMQTRPWNLDDLSIKKYVLNYDYGLPVAIKHYHDVGNTVKRDALMKTALDIANAMTTATYKMEANIALLELSKELNLQKSADIESLATSLQGLSQNLDLNNSTIYTKNSDYLYAIRSLVDTSKYLNYYLSNDAAKKVTKAIVDSFPVSPDVSDSEYLAKIKTRLSYVIGNNSGSNSSTFANYHDWFNNSIVSALIQTKEYDKAEKMIDGIAQEIDKIGDTLDAYELYTAIARAYGALGLSEKVESTLVKIKTIKEKHGAIYRTIQHFSYIDAFPQSNVASVDTDGDGKADFYNVTATPEQIAASGIELDDDIDGDGILDSEDTLPYSKKISE